MKTFINFYVPIALFIASIALLVLLSNPVPCR